MSKRKREISTPPCDKLSQLPVVVLSHVFSFLTLSNKLYVDYNMLTGYINKHILTVLKKTPMCLTIHHKQSGHVRDPPSRWLLRKSFACNPLFPYRNFMINKLVININCSTSNGVFWNGHNSDPCYFPNVQTVHFQWGSQAFYPFGLQECQSIGYGIIRHCNQKKLQHIVFTDSDGGPARSFDTEYLSSLSRGWNYDINGGQLIRCYKCQKDTAIPAARECCSEYCKCQTEPLCGACRRHDLGVGPEFLCSCVPKVDFRCQPLAYRRFCQVCNFCYHEMHTGRTLLHEKCKETILAALSSFDHQKHTICDRCKYCHCPHLSCNLRLT